MANEGEEDPLGRKQFNGENVSGEAAMPLFNSGEEFSKLCRTLAVPVDMEKKAKDVLDTLMTELDQQDHIQMSQKDLFICALYMALIDLRMPYGPNDPQLKHGNLAAPSVTVTQLLRKSNTSVKQLLEKMRGVKNLILPSEAVNQHLTSLEKTFCVMCALSHTFHRLCNGVFREEDKPHLQSNSENIIPSLPETEGVAFRKKLCWLLFLHAKHRLMKEMDLLHGFLALMCCLEHVLRSTPSFLLNSPYDVIRIGCQTSDHGNVTMLAKMCQEFEVDQRETEELSRSHMDPLFRQLMSQDGELDVDVLEDQYLSLHANEGDLNELLFLTKDPLFFPASPRANGCSAGSYTCQGAATPMTPVRATLSSIQQLKSTLAAATDGPSPKLNDYFQVCTHNPINAIKGRVERLRALFISKFEGVMSPYQSIAEPRFVLGVKLYYRMLEQLLNNDSKRLSVGVLDTLLLKDDFHASVLACCLEVVLVAYGLTRSYAVSGNEDQDSPFAFPWILETLEIQAYNFSKVLESFIRAEPSLPVDVVKHLQNIEYKILESLAWKEGSLLFEAITSSDRGASTPSKTLDQLTNPSSNQICPSAAQMFLSPAPGRLGTALVPPCSHSSAASPVKMNSVPRRSQSLSNFFIKVYRLAFLRLQKLCQHLSVSKELLHKIWTCFEKCITYRPDLVRNRHLDQILMCSLYGVCKVVERDIRFKDIVQVYTRQLPNARPEVFRSVFMSKDRYDSIINFYNQVFMVNMKIFILQFSNSSRQATPTLSPVPPSLSPTPVSPARSMMGRKNLLISPLKESPFKAPHSPSQLTPASRQLFCFGDRPGSAEKLRQINASVSQAFKRKGSEESEQPKERVRRLIHFDNSPAASRSDSTPSPTTPVRKIPFSSPISDGSSVKDADDGANLQRQ